MNTILFSRFYILLLLFTEFYLVFILFVDKKNPTKTKNHIGILVALAVFKALTQIVDVTTGSEIRSAEVGKK